MIVTEQKPFEEIINAIGESKNLIIIGCGLCATSVGTGGLKEVKQMQEKLTKEQKNVLLTEVIEAVCDQRLVRLFINKNKKIIDESDAIVIMSCGAGVKSFRKLLPYKKLVSALNSLYLATQVRLRQYQPGCNLCGDCALNLTSGYCVFSSCPRGYINAPCGGSKNGKCEVFPENDCVWTKIYNHSPEEFLNKFSKFIPPKNWNIKFSRISET